MDNITRDHCQQDTESESLSMIEAALYTTIGCFIIYFLLSLLPSLYKLAKTTNNDKSALEQLKVDVRNLQQETQRLKAELEKSVEEDSEHKSIIIDSVKGVRNDIMEVLLGFARGMEEAQGDVEQLKTQLQLDNLAKAHELP